MPRDARGIGIGTRSSAIVVRSSTREEQNLDCVVCAYVTRVGACGVPVLPASWRGPAERGGGWSVARLEEDGGRDVFRIQL